MGFVVIRRFRGGEGPATSRSYREEERARAVARDWAREGWDVEIIATGRLQHRSTRVTATPPDNFPERN